MARFKNICLLVSQSVISVSMFHTLELRTQMCVIYVI